MNSRNFFARIFCVFLFVVIVSPKISAKSVYVISRHTDSTIQVYDIAGEQLDFRYQSNETANYAVDLALCHDEDVLFASFDSFTNIELINSRDLESIRVQNVGEEMAGLAFCQDYFWLLAAERDSGNLHLFDFDRDNQLLTNDRSITLQGMSNLLGISLDETDMRLYATENSPVVRYYDFQFETFEPNFVYAGQVEIQLDDVPLDAVGAAVYNDGQGTKYLYTAGYYHQIGHSYLVRTSLTDPNAATASVGVSMGTGAQATGLAVDETTGLLYVTSHGSPASIRVYDPLNWSEDPNSLDPIQTITGADISGPTRICHYGVTRCI